MDAWVDGLVVGWQMNGRQPLVMFAYKIQTMYLLFLLFIFHSTYSLKYICAYVVVVDAVADDVVVVDFVVDVVVDVVLMLCWCCCCCWWCCCCYCRCWWCCCWCCVDVVLMLLLLTPSSIFSTLPQFIQSFSFEIIPLRTNPTSKGRKIK